MKSLPFFKLLKCFCVIFFIILFSTTTFAQFDDSLYYSNPNYLVAKELFKKRIVMLGDYGHNQPGPYHRLLNTLQNWLEICKSKKESENLTLIIETETDSCERINDFIKSGDMKHLVDSIDTEFYLENLEYYINLRKFSNEIDSINQFRKNKISFKVKGFEQPFEYIAKKPQKEQELWFVRERDSVTAYGIINYIKRNPDEKILVFYGEAHLMDGLWNKKDWGLPSITNEEGYGYFQAHFLKEKFGKENVITIDPWYYGPDFFKNSIFDSVKNKEILFKTKYLPKTEDRPKVDYIISCQDEDINPIDADNICSRYILEKLDHNAFKIKNWLPGYKANNYYNWNLSKLSYLTGISFHDDIDLKKWLDKNDYDPIDWLYSNKLSDMLENIFNQTKSKDIINYFTSMYGIAFTITDSNITNFDTWKITELPEILNQIKFTNSIGIYWLGYPDEKIKAKEYLVQFSGEDFAEPEKYLQWYRMKYFGYEY